MKALKPSMKENKRYLLLKGENLSREKIKEAILSFIGISGMSKTGLEFIDLRGEKEKKKDEMILSVNREAVNNVRASLVLLPENIKITRVSGTLKGLGKREKTGKI